MEDTMIGRNTLNILHHFKEKLGARATYKRNQERNITVENGRMATEKD
jgi:hypothetical protein